MTDHDAWSERLKRWLCRSFGHRWYESSHGEPVVSTLEICKRCGKFERSYWVRGKP